MHVHTRLCMCVNKHIHNILKRAHALKQTLTYLIHMLKHTYTNRFTLSPSLDEYVYPWLCILSNMHAPTHPNTCMYIESFMKCYNCSWHARHQKSVRLVHNPSECKSKHLRGPVPVVTAGQSAPSNLSNSCSIIIEHTKLSSCLQLKK